ncbi:MAG TPA: hypothetical protein VM866_04110 [Pyrinomonadaceae bacterium]|nr:hypothetical protein [Pyrinomonadaceae bacterium]
MKHIQIIDGAQSCTYSIFAVEDAEFEMLFHNGTDVEFSDDLFSRLGEDEATKLTAMMCGRPVDEKSVAGVHGTLFYGLGHKKKYYPTKRESEMIVVL